MADAFRARLESTCAHFNGIQHERCKAGVKYKELPDDARGIGKFPCLAQHNASKCAHHRLPTREGVQAEIDEIDRAETLFNQGLSPCCGAELDRSRLISDGRFKGSGWVYCSKCKKSVGHLHAHGGDE
jgi:hypothetical protein